MCVFSKCQHRILLCAVSCCHLLPSFCVWFRKAIIIILFFLVQMVFLSEPPGDPTVESCRKYALEGHSVTCECEARFHDDKPPDFSLTWPGYSNIPFLQLSGVRRSNNGSVFTCLMIWNGHRRTANYTLQVAYGPDNTHTTIEGPGTFFTNGTASLTLTCRATDVNPPPVYNWDTDICKTEDRDAGTCTFTPDPIWDDGRQVQCSAVGRVGGNKGVALFTINLTYPPKKPPVITGFTSGNIISRDTQLRCKVSGGKPAVSKVIFTCERLPRPYTCEPTNGSDRTESALVVNHAPPSDTNNSVLCTCRAVWEPREDMYTQTSQMLLQIPDSESVECKEHVGWLVGIFIGPALGVAVVLVLSRYFDLKKCSRLRAAKRSDPAKAPTPQPSEMRIFNDTDS